jgi:hypothetical protein
LIDGTPNIPAGNPFSNIARFKPKQSDDFDFGKGKDLFPASVRCPLSRYRPATHAIATPVAAAIDW